MSANPESVEEWMVLVRRELDAARVLLAAKQYQAAWSHSGSAVEFVLKAAIMKVERLNRWPDRDSRKDLFQHDPQRLGAVLGLDWAELKDDPIYVSWQVVCMWGRGDSYNPADMPRKVAEDMVEAASGPEGVIRWIEARYRLN